MIIVPFHPGTLSFIIGKRCSVVNFTSVCHSILKSESRSAGHDETKSLPIMTLDGSDIDNVHMDRRLEQGTILAGSGQSATVFQSYA